MGNKYSNKQVFMFNETLMNIFSNFIPNKFVTFDDRYPWMTDFVRTKINSKSNHVTLRTVLRIMIFTSLKKQ